MFKITVIVVLLISMVVPQDTGKDTGKNDIEYYESIIQKHPDLPEARFGAGCSAFNMEDYDRALSEFHSVLRSEDNVLKSKSFYNMGNTFMNSGKIKEGMAAYRESLKLNPEDYDAKYNYELSKVMLQQMQQQQQNQGEENSNEQEQNEDEQQNSQQNRESEENQEKSQGSRSDEQQDQEGDQKQKQMADAGEKQKQDAPQVDAQTILDALKADENNLMKRKFKSSKSLKLEKDW